MSMLAAVEWAPIATGVQVVTTVIVGIIGYQFKRADQRIRWLEENAVLRRDCNREDSVLKEDWLRESGKLQRGQERVLAEITELRGEMAGGAQIGAAIAEFLRTRAEKGGESDE